MSLARLPELAAYVRVALAQPGLPAEDRAVCENLSWEERVGAERQRHYAEAFGGHAGVSLDAIFLAQKRYAEDCLEHDPRSPDVPDTFADMNGTNAWRHIEQNLYLFRIESAEFALRDSGVDIRELELALSDRTAKADVLARVCKTWNQNRDRRPAFATTAIAVQELLDDAGDNWPNFLRDELGLGHLSPPPGAAPVPVLLMTYRVKEVLDDKTSGKSGFAIPTMIDGRLNPYFFPTPIPAAGSDAAQYEVGRAVNLRPAADQSTYHMGMELVHSRIDYLPRHIDRIGLISRPVTAKLTAQRGFHLDWLRLETGRNDFGLPA